jgi:hypothetical protein
MNKLLLLAAAALCLYAPRAAAANRTKMTEQEKIDWYCAQHPGPNCHAEAIITLPYISDYARYENVDSAGRDMLLDDGGCDFSPKPLWCPGGQALDPVLPSSPAPPTLTPTPPPSGPPTTTIPLGPPGTTGTTGTVGGPPAATGQPTGGGCHDEAPITMPLRYAGSVQRFEMSAQGVGVFPVPVATRASAHGEIVTCQSTLTPADLQVEVALSNCRGDFNVPAACRQSGSAWSGIDLHFFAQPEPTNQYCVLEPGRTAYANLRFLNCREGSCHMVIQLMGSWP